MEKTTLIFLITLAISCQAPKLPDPIYLQPSSSITLEVAEPSGLALSSSSSNLLVVSDKKDKVFEISLSGVIIKEYNFKGEDVEGVTQLADSSIWIVEEQSNQLIHLDKQGNLVSNFSISIIQQEENHGLEGITYNEATQEFYMLAEKNPARLIVTDNTGSILEEHSLDFAKDYSGIYHSSEENLLYIVSDQSQLFAQCELDGSPRQIYNFDIPKAEGIAVDEEQGTVYIVSDQTGEMYTFQL